MNLFEIGNSFAMKLFTVSGILCFCFTMFYILGVIFNHHKRAVVFERIIGVLLYIFVGAGGFTLLLMEA